MVADGFVGLMPRSGPRSRTSRYPGEELLTRSSGRAVSARPVFNLDSGSLPDGVKGGADCDARDWRASTGCPMALVEGPTGADVLFKVGILLVCALSSTRSGDV